jgi:hypothetical protein
MKIPARCYLTSKKKALEIFIPLGTITGTCQSLEVRSAVSYSLIEESSSKPCCSCNIPLQKDYGEINNIYTHPSFRRSGSFVSASPTEVRQPLSIINARTLLSAVKSRRPHTKRCYSRVPPSHCAPQIPSRHRYNYPSDLSPRREYSEPLTTAPTRTITIRHPDGYGALIQARSRRRKAGRISSFMASSGLWCSGLWDTLLSRILRKFAFLLETEKRGAWYQRCKGPNWGGTSLRIGNRMKR